MKHRVFGLAMLFTVASFSNAVAATTCTDAAGKNVIIEGTLVNIKSFGALGTGTVDASGPVQAALNCLRSVMNADESSSGTLFIPAGRYRMDKAAVLSQQATDAAWQGIRLLGEGPRSSKLIGNNASGIVAITVARRDVLVEIKDIGFVAAIARAGTAVAISMPVGGNRHNRSLIARDIEISGASPESNAFFTDGIRTSGLWRPILDNVLMTGPFGPKAPVETGPAACFTLDDAYSPTIIHSACWSARRGLVLRSAVDAGPEGVMITLSKFVNVDVGIQIENKGKEPEGMISDNHINARRYGIQMDGKKFVTINNNLFYSEDSGGFFQDIYLKKVEKIMIRDNIFHYPAKTYARNELTASIRIEADSQDVTIASNSFNAPGTAISIGEGVRATRILDNRIFKKNRLTRLPVNEVDVSDRGMDTYIRSLPAEATD